MELVFEPIRNGVFQVGTPGMPGLIELLIILLLGLVLAVVVGGWVYRDAKARGSEPAWGWAGGIVLLFLLGLFPGLVGIALYLTVRGDRVK